MWQFLDQIGFLLAFLGGLAGIFGLADGMVRVWMGWRERKQIARHQAIRVAPTAWN